VVAARRAILLLAVEDVAGIAIVGIAARVLKALPYGRKFDALT
jgi:hypothetical protein